MIKSRVMSCDKAEVHRTPRSCTKNHENIKKSIPDENEAVFFICLGVKCSISLFLPCV